MCILILLSTILGAAVDGTTYELVDFTAESMPVYMQLNNVQLSRIEEGRRADFEVVDWPNINFVAPEAGWDWHAYAGLAVTLYNPGDASVNVSMRLDNDGRRWHESLQHGIGWRAAKGNVYPATAF